MIDTPVSSPPQGSMLEVGYRQIAAAANRLKLSEPDRDRLLAPERVIESWIPDPRSGRSVIRALRVQHSTQRGPAKGGMRLAENVDREEVGALALFMTLKTAVADLPLGGGKGGVIVAPSDLSEDQRIELFEAIAQRWAPVIGPDHDVLGPDVGTGPDEMDALHRGWRTARSSPTGTPSTGKSVEQGGLEFRSGATARGLDMILQEIEGRLGLADSYRFAVQGYGSVGRGIAERLIKRGHTLVAISDSSGGAHNPDGLDLDEMDSRRDAEGTVADGDTSSSEVLGVECDLLIPAALQGVIGKDVAESVQAQVVVEGANGPCTWDGIEVLEERSITVCPDILANSGGVSASFQEMTEPGERPTEEEIVSEFEKRLRSAAAAVVDRAESDDIQLRSAATMIALERVLDR